jgi:hypothetical protein
VEQHETLRPRVHHRGKHGPALSLESPALRVLGAQKDGAFEAELLKGLIQRLRAPGVFGHGWTPAISVIHLGVAVIPDRVRALPYWCHLATDGRSER